MPNCLGVMVNSHQANTDEIYHEQKTPSHQTLQLQLQHDQPKQHQFPNLGESEDKYNLFSRASFVFF
jgi:hypothetical protein